MRVKGYFTKPSNRRPGPQGRGRRPRRDDAPPQSNVYQAAPPRRVPTRLSSEAPPASGAPPARSAAVGFAPGVGLDGGHAEAVAVRWLVAQRLATSPPSWREAIPRDRPLPLEVHPLDRVPQVGEV